MGLTRHSLLRGFTRFYVRLKLRPLRTWHRSIARKRQLWFLLLSAAIALLPVENSDFAASKPRVNVVSSYLLENRQEHVHTFDDRHSTQARHHWWRTKDQSRSFSDALSCHDWEDFHLWCEISPRRSSRQQFQFSINRFDPLICQRIDPSTNDRLRRPFRKFHLCLEQFIWSFNSSR